MSSNSITEKDGAKDNYYVQTVSMDAPITPAPNMQPVQRTFGNPVCLFIINLSTLFNGHLGASGHDGLRYCLPVLINIDARNKECWLTQLGLGFRCIVSFGIHNLT